MKTPLDPMLQDLVDARGRDSRKKRDAKLRSADTKSCGPEQSLSGCNGTETLASIERALSRLSSGTYGICLSCGADISLRRLEQNPAVETCETCRETAQFKAH